MRIVKWVAIALLCAIAAIAQESRVGLSVNRSRFVIHCVNAREREQVEIRTKINKLILQTFVDDEHGVHDIRKFRAIKKLAEELDE